jgi:hypothetical protein
MTDNAERWRNVAQAAQWLAEGRVVEVFNPVEQAWEPLAPTGIIAAGWSYRLKPEPPKPATTPKIPKPSDIGPEEWILRGTQNGVVVEFGWSLPIGVVAHVREVREVIE